MTVTLSAFPSLQWLSLHRTHSNANECLNLSQAMPSALTYSMPLQIGLRLKTISSAMEQLRLRSTNATNTATSDSEWSELFSRYFERIFKLTFSFFPAWNSYSDRWKFQLTQCFSTWNIPTFSFFHKLYTTSGYYSFIWYSCLWFQIK